MKQDEKTLQRVFAIKLSSVYPLYIAKGEKKARTKALRKA